MNERSSRYVNKVIHRNLRELVTEFSLKLSTVFMLSEWNKGKENLVGSTQGFGIGDSCSVT